MKGNGKRNDKTYVLAITDSNERLQPPPLLLQAAGLDS